MTIILDTAKYDVATLATIRDKAIVGIEARMSAERSGKGRGTSVGQWLDHKNDLLGTTRNTIDNYSLIGLDAFDVDVTEYLTSSRSKQALCNIYSWPKMLSNCAAFVRGKFGRMGGGDDAVNACTIVALVEGKGLARVEELMTGVRRYQGFAGLVTRYVTKFERGEVYTYGSGQTQHGSGLRSLHGMGVITAGGKIIPERADDFDVLVKAAYAALKANMAAPDADFPQRNTPRAPEMPSDWRAQVFGTATPAHVETPASDAENVTNETPADGWQNVETSNDAEHVETPAIVAEEVAPALSDDDMALLAELDAQAASEAPAKAKRARKSKSV